MGGFPTNSLTEDFELSIRMHEAGFKSRYISETLASGLGPEDMASYVSQQHRWARGLSVSLASCSQGQAAVAFAYAVLVVVGLLLKRLHNSHLHELAVHQHRLRRAAAVGDNV